MMLFSDASYTQSLQLLPEHERQAWQPRDTSLRTLVGTDETRVEPSKKTRPNSEYQPARGIKQFTAPTIQLKGTAEEIGLDSRTLAKRLEAKFLREFAFLQDDFTFETKYETWEIGLFDCEVWTVGSNYPIALHIQCTGGSMDEPGQWRHANLGYGPKEKLGEIVTKGLESILAEYATFMRRSNA
jgi:hypothetical protein